nr:uncharacterized protein LOC123771303 [Procambarus clarkii]
MAASTSLRVLTLPVVLVLCLIHWECMYGVAGIDCGKPDCRSTLDGGKVADPTNCRQFYFCVSGEPTEEPFVCEEGMIFNSTVEDCVPGDTCVTQCSPCSYECPDVPEPPTYIADRYNCSIYHECVSEATHFCEANKPYFDGSSCQANKANCCSCKPYCSDSDLFSYVIDPTDCKRYYFCDTIGVPQYSLECQFGNFDITTNKCSDSAPCILFCPNM